MSTDSVRATVLLVADEPELLDVMAFDLKFSGYRVLTAMSNREAIEHLSGPEPIELMITGTKTLDSDCLELLDDMRSELIDYPAVILVSGLSEVDFKDLYQRGVESVLSKPFDLSTLEELLSRSLLPLSKRWGQPAADASSHEVTLKREFDSIDSALNSQEISFGRGGMAVLLKTGDLKVGHLIRFEIQFSGQVPRDLKGQGIVRWVQSSNEHDANFIAGIEFLYFEDASRDAAIGLVSSLRTQAFIPELLSSPHQKP